MTETVVLLPLVPVTQTTRRRSASASQRPRPPTTGMPRADRCATLGRYLLRPGVFTTTSQPSRAASPPSSVASTRRPSVSAFAGGWSSTSTGSTPSASSLRRLAWPSRPRPHRPTLAPARSDQESFGRAAVIGIRPDARSSVPGGDEGLADRRKHGRYVRVRWRIRPACHLAGQFAQQAVTCPVGAARGEQHRGAALVDLADALERLGARAEQRPELPGERRILKRLAGRREDPVERRGRQERGEDQVDEAALVALPAPVIEPARRIAVEGLVAAAERAVVLLERGEL